MKMSPPVPVPPPTPGRAPQPAAPLAPALSPAATLALLIQDGLVGPGTRTVDFFLSSQELRVNGELQPAALQAKYYQEFKLAGNGGFSTVALKLS